MDRPKIKVIKFDEFIYFIMKSILLNKCYIIYFKCLSIYISSFLFLSGNIPKIYSAYKKSIEIALLFLNK